MHGTGETNGQGAIGFYASNPPQGTAGVGLFDFAIVGNVRERIDSQPVNGVGGSPTGGSTIQNLYVGRATRWLSWWCSSAIVLATCTIIPRIAHRSCAYTCITVRQSCVFALEMKHHFKNKTFYVHNHQKTAQPHCLQAHQSNLPAHTDDRSLTRCCFLC